MFRRAVLAATFIALMPTIAPAALAQPPKAIKPPAPVMALYDGDKAPKGAWRALRSAELWSRLPVVEGNELDSLVVMEEAWYVQRTLAQLQAQIRTNAARSDCLAKRKRRPAACERIEIRPAVSIDPAVFAAGGAGDDNVAGLRAGLIRHRAAFAAPEGWNEEVMRLRAEPDIEKKLAKAAAWVNARLTYYRRATDPLGRAGDSVWFAEWSQGIESMFERGYGDCRDYSLAQYALAVEGGVPTDSIAIAAFLMASSPKPESLSEEARAKDIVHINVVARTPQGTVVLSQSKDLEKPLAPASRSILADRGVLMIATSTGAQYLAPTPAPSTIASR